MTLPTCFVVTGFGVKTDPATGRALDLDQTFETLVRPACDAAGINAFRAIDANVTGSIDAIMYRWIYAADYVIADLSTLNANVFYELGVRHAQRPNTTIIIAEELLLSRIPFDLSSFVVHAYAHGGASIAAAEQTRFVGHLSGVLGRIRAAEEARRAEAGGLPPETDSPVFKFLAGMAPPEYRPDSFLAPPAWVPPQERDAASDAAGAAPGETLAEMLEAADAARRNRDFETAKILLETALERSLAGRTAAKPDPHIIRQLVLVTYKAGEGGTAEEAQAALHTAEALLERHCAPGISTDPETLGLAGAIQKRLFELTGESAALDRAIGFYERGFYIRQDYYNGINAAFMHTLRAATIEDMTEATVSFGYANMLRRKIVDICNGLLSEPEGREAEREWIYATLAEAFQGLGEAAEQARVERLMQAEASEFAKASHAAQKARLAEAIAAFEARRAPPFAGGGASMSGADGLGPRETVAQAGDGPAGRISIVPEIEPGRRIRAVEITCRIDYET